MIASHQALGRRLAALGEALDLRAALRPRGSVIEVGDGVARVAGLDGVGFEELVAFDSGALGLAYDLAAQHTGVVLLAGAGEVRAGEGVVATGHPPEVPVGPALLGRLVDPLGRPLDVRATPGSAPTAAPRLPVFRPAPPLTARAPVTIPLHTGVLVVDAAIPIGRGQRQLLVGDRNVGKTALALDFIAAQTPGDVMSVFVVVGQPFARALAIVETLADVGALARTVVVAADAGAPPGMQYLAPYAGATIAESFAADGRHVLVVYDDLTKHADAYRELALLLGRPPGREAYPGDIFHIHAELLERATALAAGGSVTAIPIAETTSSDISAYIPTNLISITDGQLYLDAARFERNRRPAVDIGRSVSRIGGAAQTPLMRRAARSLRLTMARFEALESLTRVGLDVDPNTKRAVERGRLVRELLCQPRLQPIPVASEILVLLATGEGWLDGAAPAVARRALGEALRRLGAEAPDLARALVDGREPDGAAAEGGGWLERLRALVAECLARAS
ncbi:MAG: F0F1 ATP synthase subunit alpha [Myxococcota bacterium]